MPTYFAVVNESYTKIYLVIEDGSQPHSFINVYHKNVYQYTIAAAFAYTNTSLGARYIYELLPLTEFFADGPWHFEFANNLVLASQTDIDSQTFGVVIDKNIVCCITKYLNSVAPTNECSGISTLPDEILTVYAFLVASKTAVKAKDYALATCSFKSIENLCEAHDCGC